MGAVNAGMAGPSMSMAPQTGTHSSPVLVLGTSSAPETDGNGTSAMTGKACVINDGGAVICTNGRLATSRSIEAYLAQP